SAYVVLTNVSLRWREVLPGAAVAAVLLEATFQALPVYVRASKHDPVLQTLSGPAVLLVWLYVMANLIVVVAEVNFHLRARRAVTPAPAPPVLGANAGASSRPRSPRPFGSRPRG